MSEYDGIGKELAQAITSLPGMPPMSEERPKGPGSCKRCGVRVQPRHEEVLDRWWTPPLCGEPWVPGAAVVGCQGRVDAEEWGERVKQQDWERRLTGAGLPEDKPKLRAKMGHPLLPQLTRFERPTPDSTAAWGLTLIGATGTGKTSALVSAARHYLTREDPWRVRYITEAALMHSLRPQGKLPPRRELEFYHDFELLLVDEIGQDSTAWAVAQMGRLLDHRYESGRPIVLASNFGPGGLERVYGQRFVDRLLEMGGGRQEEAFLGLAFSWRHLDAKGRPTQRPVPE